jgi:RHS repeat-associated protein
LLSRRGFTCDAASQLTGIDDLGRGVLADHYDPVGRLIQAKSRLGQESFAFDPASNMIDAARAPTDTVQSHAGVPVYTYRRTTGVLDNLLREYAGTHYSYDAYGNLSERVHNGVRSRYTWDDFDRLIQYEDERVQVYFYYDALNRRQMKDSSTRYRTCVQETKHWNEQQHAQRDREQDCGLTLYGWSGDTLAWESRNGRTTHYFYEPESFVPLAQAVSHKRISLHAQPVYSGHYDIEQDPLWTTMMEPPAVDAVAWYQVDHLGTPQELTDEAGELAWSAQYKAWSEAKKVISEAANRAGIKNPLRFQGQYFAHETELHYNRHRYYDPQVGRFVGKDPIGLAGGYNLYAYVRNRPTTRIDPLGLQDFGALFGAGTRERAFLGNMYKSGYSHEEVANTLYPPRPRRIATLECRAS